MKNFITGLITAGVVVYVALIYHSTGMLYCAVWIVCFLLLLLGFHLLFFRKLRFSFDKIAETVASGEQMTLAVWHRIAAFAIWSYSYCRRGISRAERYDRGDHYRLHASGRSAAQIGTADTNSRRVDAFISGRCLFSVGICETL